MVKDVEGKIHRNSLFLGLNNTKQRWFPIIFHFKTIHSKLSMGPFLQDMGYCLKWCGRPQWCLSPILDADGALTDELVKDELFLAGVRWDPLGSSFFGRDVAKKRGIQGALIFDSLLSGSSRM